MKNNKYLTSAILTAFLFVLGAIAASAQTTEFTYQGRLTDTGTAANTNYDFQFALFDAPAAGTQLGSTLTVGGVPVSGGVFTVRLDFGAQFTGAPRYLQITVRQTGSATAFVTLNPRQAITSTPYAVRSLNAGVADTATNSEQLGGIAANQYVQTNDTRMSDDRNPLAGSDNYIQNTPNQQNGASFNISGNGTVGGTLSANFVNSARQYNIGGNRVLGASGNNNIFAGFGAGEANNGGVQNSFFGDAAGKATTTGSFNSFFGREAGRLNTTGFSNAFFGYQAGFRSSTLCCNSFFGTFSGQNTDAGGGNAFFGYASGNQNSAGGGNSFYGDSAGYSNTTADYNSFFGRGAGFYTTTGANNSFFGAGGGSK
jgi:hypothetical protein